MTMTSENGTKVTPVNTASKGKQKTAGTRLPADVHARLVSLAKRRTETLGRKFTKADVIACFIIDGLEREAA